MSLYNIPNITNPEQLVNQTNYFVCSNVLDASTCGGILGSAILFAVFIAVFSGFKFYYTTERALKPTSTLVMIISIFFWWMGFVKMETVIVTTIIFALSMFVLKGEETM